MTPALDNDMKNHGYVESEVGHLRREAHQHRQAASRRTAKLADTYRQHGGWLIAFLRRRFGREQAEDIAQEAFTRVAASSSPIRNPRAYLASVAVHAALEQAAKERRDLEAPCLPQVAWPDQDAALQLEQVIMSLPHDVREVFLLSRFAGLSNVEIAGRCNLSVKRIEAKITKARAICAALMRD